MVLPLMSHVECKKRLCRCVEFSGPDNKTTELQKAYFFLGILMVCDHRLLHPGGNVAYLIRVYRPQPRGAGGGELVATMPGCVCPKVKDMGPFWASRE